MSSNTASGGRVFLVAPQDLPERITSLLAVQGWTHGRASSPNESLRCIRGDRTIDVALIAPGPGVRTYLELCRSIKFDQRTSFVMVVVLLDPEHTEMVARAFDAGADDCIMLTSTDAEITMRIRKAINYKHATDSLEDSAAVIKALANAVEGKDAYTCGHVERVAMYSVQIGRQIGVDAEGLNALQIGGIVHDIGKIGIPEQILNKPGKLTEEEMAIMRRHPVIGYDIIKPLRTFQNVLPIVRWHHERPNGTGYPDGIGGNDFPLLARITAVADIFDALSTDRPYRPGFPIPKCKAILTENAEKGDLDPELVKVLFAILDDGMIVPNAATVAA